MTLATPCFFRYSTPCLTSSGIFSKSTSASLFWKRVLRQRTAKPRRDNSVHSGAVNLSPVRWTVSTAMFGIGPLSGRYSSALAPPDRGTKVGLLCASTGDAANAAARQSVRKIQSDALILIGKSPVFRECAALRPEIYTIWMDSDESPAADDADCMDGIHPCNRHHPRPGS